MCSEVTAEFLPNLRAVTFSHGLRNENAYPVRKQRVSPEHLHAARLVWEVRLMGQRYGHGRPWASLSQRAHSGRFQLFDTVPVKNPIEVTWTLARRLSTSLAIAFDPCPH